MENNYKKIYEKHYNIKIPKGYDIHHINLDHNDNSVENLVMLPRKLHQMYHKLFNMIPDTITPNKHISIFGRNANKFICNTISEFDVILEECNKWLDYREYLVGRMPNIHNIEVNNGNIENK